MQAKVFFSSFLAAILAVGVISTPVDIESASAAVESTPPADVNTLFENSGGAAFAGVPDPQPNGPITTPKEDDVLAPSTGVTARDLEHLEKRTPGCVRATTDPRFAGTSVYTCKVPKGRCAELTPYWASRISSFRPDPSTLCQLYTGPYCTGTRSIIFGWPGYGRLGIFDNHVGSLKCWW